jgi:hypothetical protein
MLCRCWLFGRLVPYVVDALLQRVCWPGSLADALPLWLLGSCRRCCLARRRMLCRYRLFGRLVPYVVDALLQECVGLVRWRMLCRRGYSVRAAVAAWLVDGCFYWMDALPLWLVFGVGTYCVLLS